MYKMLCLDLDDTLLMPDLTIPQEVCDALRELIARGVLVTLATGRMFPSAQKYARTVGITAPLVCYNGAVIRAADDEKARFASFLPQQVVQRIFLLAAREGWYLQLYNDDRIVVAQRTEFTERDGDLLNAPCVEVGDLRQADLGPTPKIMTAGEPEELSVRLALLRAELDDALYIATSKPYLLEMMDKGVSKAHSLDRLAQLSGILPEEAVACGDSTNDAEMLAWAGVGCCMANGLPSLKARADYVCANERSYGVLEVIQRFFK